ncbi:MAG: hypothetical protein ABI867_14585 [Kofleriaceae bacterium]
MATFTSRDPGSRYQASYPDALAVYCSDGRFSHAIEELFRHLEHPRLDTLTVPGGAGLLNHRTSGYTDCDTLTRGAEFLIRGHHITFVVLLAHENCGFYATKYPDLSHDEILKRQRADLLLAKAELEASHPRLEVSAYLAIPEGDQVRFDPIPA